MRHRLSEERGIAAVELALLVPVLAIVLLGAIDFGRVFYAYISVGNAAHQAAVYAARFYAPDVQVTNATLSAVVTAESAGFLKTATTGGNTVVSGPTVVVGDKVNLARVEVTYSFVPLTPLPLKGPLPVKAVATAALPGNVH